MDNRWVLVYSTDNVDIDITEEPDRNLQQKMGPVSTQVLTHNKKFDPSETGCNISTVFQNKSFFVKFSDTGRFK